MLLQDFQTTDVSLGEVQFPIAKVNHPPSRRKELGCLIPKSAFKDRKKNVDGSFGFDAQGIMRSAADEKALVDELRALKTEIAVCGQAMRKFALSRFCFCHDDLPPSFVRDSRGKSRLLILRTMFHLIGNVNQLRMKTSAIWRLEPVLAEEHGCSAAMMSPNPDLNRDVDNYNPDSNRDLNDLKKSLCPISEPAEPPARVAFAQAVQGA